jgi:isoleucyl-tRNA synthetase
LLDRYILAKTRELVDEVTTELEDFDSPFATARLRDFADVLTNWYVRRSRDRFWQGDADAFDTLYTVLETVSRVAAPLIPLVSEEIWRGLTGGRSVHLEDWPDAAAFPEDHPLVAEMDYAREIASAGLTLRKARYLRVRLPLAKLTVVTARDEWFEGVDEILRDELNVKAVGFEPLAEGSLESFGISRKLTVNARALGPRLGKQVQAIIQAAKAGDWVLSGETVTVGDTALEPGEFDLELEAADASSAIAFLSDGGFVILDTETTPELEAEGLARDIVRAIQDTRKAAGLDVSDRITLAITGSSSDDISALARFAEMIAGETLALETAFEVSPEPEAKAAIDSAAGSQRATLPSGQYANTGVLVIDVWKSGAVNV